MIDKTQVPTQAITHFIRWNLQLIIGRARDGQFYSCIDQFAFCLREINFLASVYPTAIILRLFIKEISNYFTFRLVRKALKKLGVAPFLNILVLNLKHLATTARLKNTLHSRIKINKDRGFAVDTDAIRRFLTAMRQPNGTIFEYRYSAQSAHPTLYASVYACMTMSLLGDLQKLSAEERHLWLGYFDSYQSPDDGLFWDPLIYNVLYPESDWWGARHLALHMISAYTALGGRPKYPFKFLKRYYDHNQINHLLNNSDWKGTLKYDDDIDNKIMNIGSLLQYQRDTWDDLKAGSAVTYLKKSLRDHINPATGMWGFWNIEDRHQRSRMVQFAYHLFPLFFYDMEIITSPNKVVDIVLETQNFYGGFGVKINSSACEDIDSIDILCRLADQLPARRAEIDSALLKAKQWVIFNQVADGGFVFRMCEPFVYGHQEMSSGRNNGSIFPTWFRLLSLAYIDRHFNEQNFTISKAPGLVN